MSGLMGIVFGCSIIYIISRLVASQRRITALEQHITRKADDDVVVALTTRVGALHEETTKVLTTISSDMKHALCDSTPEPCDNGGDDSHKENNKN